MRCWHLSNFSADYNLNMFNKNAASVTWGRFDYITTYLALIEEISEIRFNFPSC